MKYVAILLISAVTAWICTKASIWLAVRYGVLDRPSDHKIHGRITPRLGGVGIISGAVLGMAAAVLLGFHFDAQILVLAVGGIAMAILGIIDDVLCLKATHKLAGQIVIAGGVGLGIAQTSTASWEGLMGAIITALLVVLMSNAVNLIDGMDGLAAGIVLVASCAYALILLSAGGVTSAIVSMVVAGACLGFLRHNWHPAHTFMGDSGSLFLGYCLAVQMRLSFAESTSVWGYTACIVIAGLPLLDTLLSIIRRLLAHRPLFSPDTAHAYNVLNERFRFGHLKTVLTFYLAGACIALVGVFAFMSTKWQAGLSILMLCILIGFVINKLKLLRMEG